MKKVALYFLILFLTGCSTTPCGKKGFNWGYSLVMIKTGNHHKALVAGQYISIYADRYCENTKRKNEK